MKKNLFSLIYGAALFLFTLFIALDTFVLRASYQTEATQMDTSMLTEIAPIENGTETPKPSSAEPYVPDDRPAPGELSGERQNEKPPSDRSGRSDPSDSEPGISVAPAEDIAASADKGTASITDTTYQDENISISMSEFVQYDTVIYVADIRLSSIEYLKTAFAENTYGKNITAKTSEIASEHNAILAINGDYYGAQEKGYVIRNGILFREKSNSEDVLCVYADGTMAVADPDTVTAQELADSGVWQAFSFGPGLLENGQITVTQDQEVGRSKASNPRTAIGMIAPGHYVFVVSDGRTEDSAGLSLYQLAQIMQSLGVQVGYNLDGGGSSTMVFMGEIVNNPTTGGRIKERSVSDIVYIG